VVHQNVVIIVLKLRGTQWFLRITLFLSCFF